VSFDAIMYLVVGGTGTLAGPVIGAFILTDVPELLRFFEEYRLFFYSVVLILTVIFFPQGLIGLPGFIKSKVSKYQKRREIPEVN
ncbi:MAG: branched-chain amino acid ABC transporter permease, partial [Pseudomonadota bacterium]